MAHPLISVVSPCYNDGQYIPECVACVQAQTWPAVEHIIVDDGSTEAATQEQLKWAEAQGVRVVRRPNGGLAAARNTGIDHARGAFVFFLDIDDLILPTCLAGLVEALARKPGAAFAYTHVREFGARRRWLPSPRFNAFQELLENRWNPGVLVRREVFEAGFRFDESLRLGYEDWEFWIRLIAAGYEGVLCPQWSFWYRIREGSMLRSVTLPRHQFLVEEIRSRHEALYSPQRLVALKRRWSPAITFVAGAGDGAESVGVLAAKLAGQSCEDWEIVADAAEARGRWLVGLRGESQALDLWPDAVASLIARLQFCEVREINVAVFARGENLEAVALDRYVATRFGGTAVLHSRPEALVEFIRRLNLRRVVCRMGLARRGGEPVAAAIVEQFERVGEAGQPVRPPKRTRITPRHDPLEAGNLVELHLNSLTPGILFAGAAPRSPWVNLIARDLGGAGGAGRLGEFATQWRALGYRVQVLLLHESGPRPRVRGCDTVLCGAELVPWSRLRDWAWQMIHATGAAAVHLLGESEARRWWHELRIVFAGTRLVSDAPLPLAEGWDDYEVCAEPGDLPSLLERPARTWGGAAPSPRRLLERLWLGENPFAADALRRVLESLRRQGFRRVALFGAGRHTQRALGSERWDGPPAGLSIVAILDDAPDKAPRSIGGIRVCGTESISPSEIDALVVSSDCYAHEMAQRLEGWRAEGVAVAVAYRRSADHLGFVICPGIRCGLRDGDDVVLTDVALGEKTAHSERQRGLVWDLDFRDPGAAERVTFEGADRADRSDAGLEVQLRPGAELHIRLAGLDGDFDLLRVRLTRMRDGKEPRIITADGRERIAPSAIQPVFGNIDDVVFSLRGLRGRIGWNLRLAPAIGWYAGTIAHVSGFRSDECEASVGDEAGPLVLRSGLGRESVQCVPPGRSGCLRAEGGEQISVRIAAVEDVPLRPIDIPVNVHLEDDQGRTLPVTAESSGPWRRLRATLPGDARVVRLCVGSGERHRVAVARARVVRHSEACPLDVIMISVDALRADYVEPLGAKARTPVLAELAREGIAFTRNWSAAPFTLPSHAAMLSGCWPWRLGIFKNNDAPPRDYPALPRVLADRGYYTAAHTGGGLVSHLYFGGGFHVFQEEEGIGQIPLADQLEHIEQYLRDAAGAPLFLFIHSFFVHEYYHPATLRAMAPDMAFDDIDEETAHALTLIYRDRRRRLPEKVHALARRLYRCAVERFDRHLGELFCLLRRYGRFERAVLAVLSDHGEEFFEHGSYHHGQSLFEEMIRVPLILRLPGGPRGFRFDGPSSTCDLVPTIMAACGVEDGAERDGANLWPLLRERRTTGDPERIVVAGHYNEPCFALAARQGPRKRIFHVRDGRWEEFDLDADPLEQSPRGWYGGGGDDALAEAIRSALFAHSGAVVVRLVGHLEQPVRFRLTHRLPEGLPLRLHREAVPVIGWEPDRRDQVRYRSGAEPALEVCVGPGRRDVAILCFPSGPGLSVEGPGVAECRLGISGVPRRLPLRLEDADWRAMAVPPGFCPEVVTDSAPALHIWRIARADEARGTVGLAPAEEQALQARLAELGYVE